MFMYVSPLPLSTLNVIIKMHADDAPTPRVDNIRHYPPLGRAFLLHR